MTTEIMKLSKQKRDARILELAHKGMAQRKIAEMVNVTQPTVLSVLKRSGFVYDELDQRKKNRRAGSGRADDVAEPVEVKTPIRINLVQKQYKNGMKLSQLARLYEVDEQTLEPMIKGIEQKRRNVRDEEEDPAILRKKRREARDARILELTKAGKNQSEVANIVGVTRRTVSNALKNFGYTGKSRKLKEGTT